MADSFVPTARTKLRRRPQRGHYDRKTVHGILDAAFICHVGYLIEGKPVVTPTALLMRLLRKVPLQLRFDSAARSYWIQRTPPGPAPDSMNRQF